ncbi:MAG: group 2 Ig protein [Paenibacillaceae bacterium]|jgi:hypothetical protein|nr:group 2 Ig protein [Paenibacillaceae bacterium]
MRLKRALLLTLFLALIVNTFGFGGTAAHAADEISSLVLNKNELSLEVGGTASLTATAVYVSGATESATVKTEWNSGSADVASVYAGVVTAKKEGTAVITATYMGKTVIVNVTVVKKVRSLVKDKQTIDLRKGQSEDVALTAYYDDGTTEDVTKKAEWNIDNASVATVVNGKITGQTSGKAVVTAKFNNQTVTIPVNIEIVKRIDPSVKEISLLLDDDVTIELNATYPDGQVKNVAGEAVWESADPDVADIIKGKITAYGPGDTEITATYGTKSAVIKVNVDKTVKLSLNKTSVLMKKDAYEQLTLTAVYADESSDDVTGRAVWSTSDESIVSVVKGKLIANAVGEATVTAKFSGKEVSALVNVDVPKALIVDQEDIFLQTGTAMTSPLVLTAIYADGTTENVTDKAVWSVNDSTIANVIKGKITTYKAGNAVVTGKYGDKSVTVKVAVDIPNSILLSKKTVNFQIGSSEEIKLTALYSAGREVDATSLAEWTTSDSEIADVRKGVITGIGTGVAQITVKYGTRTASVTVSVGVLKSLSLNETELTVAKGESFSLIANATYTDGTVKDVTKEAVWSSSNTKAVTVNEEGQLKSVAAGSAEVSAVFGGKTVVVDIQVDMAESLTASPTLLSFDLNQVMTIQLTAKDRDGNTVTVADKAQWTSANSQIALVDKGVVTPVSRGKTTITAKYGGQTVTVQVEIGVVQSLTMDKRVISTKSGQSVQLALTATLSDGTKKDMTSSADWKSSTYKVADVNGGLVTGIGAGTATITASFGGKTATAAVDVDSLKYLKTDHVLVEMKAGASFKVTATATYTDQSEEDVSVSGLWTTSNIRVADVKDGTIRAIGKGKATITITFAKKRTTVYVTVK